jgi:hypothetical protein
MALSGSREPSRRPAPTVRAYYAEDRELIIAQLAPLIASLYPDGQDWLDRRLTDVAAGDATSEIVGTPAALQGITIETPKSPRRVKLSTIWVPASCRNQGVGSVLIDSRRRDWLRRGVREASLTARADVASDLERLLLPRGFDIVDVEADRYGEGLDEVIFQWRARRDPGATDRGGSKLLWRGGQLSRSA